MVAPVDMQSSAGAEGTGGGGPADGFFGCGRGSDDDDGTRRKGKQREFALGFSGMCDKWLHAAYTTRWNHRQATRASSAKQMPPLPATQHATATHRRRWWYARRREEERRRRRRRRRRTGRRR